jgi:hypothetical protein
MGGILGKKAEADVVGSAKLGDKGGQVGCKVISNDHLYVFGREGLDMDQEHLFAGIIISTVLHRYFFNIQSDDITRLCGRRRNDRYDSTDLLTVT